MYFGYQGIHSSITHATWLQRDRFQGVSYDLSSSADNLSSLHGWCVRHLFLEENRHVLTGPHPHFSRRRSIVAGRRPGDHDDDDGDDAAVSRRRLLVEGEMLLLPPPPLHETREMITKTQR
jgi:hypothetical protein